VRVRLIAASAVLYGALVVPIYVEDTWSFVVPETVAVYAAVSSLLLAVGTWLDLAGLLGEDDDADGD
jgi:hypothetical protein